MSPNPSFLDRRPDSSEHSPYFANYIRLVPDGSILGQLRAQLTEMANAFRGIDDQRASKVDPPYSWTLKQVLGHLSDSERVFGYRAARIGAGDKTPLPGFDQDAMIAGSDYSLIALGSLLDEWSDLRRANVRLFERLRESNLTHMGSADGKPVTARAIAYVIVGHVNHHLAIIRKRLA